MVRPFIVVLSLRVSTVKVVVSRWSRAASAKKKIVEFDEYGSGTLVVVNALVNAQFYCKEKVLEHPHMRLRHARAHPYTQPSCQHFSS
jgi:hypothetical protein